MTVFVSEPYVQARRGGGSIASNLIYTQFPTVEGNELVLPFIDGGEQRVTLPAGSGGIAGVRTVRSADDETDGALQISLDNTTWSTIAEIELQPLKPTFLRRMCYALYDRTDDILPAPTEARFLGPLGVHGNQRLLTFPASDAADLVGKVVRIFLWVPDSTIAGETLGEGATPLGTMLGDLEFFGEGDPGQFAQGNLLRAYFPDEAPTALTVDGRVGRVYSGRGGVNSIFVSSRFHRSFISRLTSLTV